ncbi:MAG: hypothetical protein ACRDN0_19500, partial [Trebonia sp.]
HRPSRKLSGSIAGCGSGNSLSIVRASPDHLDRRIPGGKGYDSVGEDQDRRAQHSVHSTRA